MVAMASLSLGRIVLMLGRVPAVLPFGAGGIFKCGKTVLCTAGCGPGLYKGREQPHPPRCYSDVTAAPDVHQGAINCPHPHLQCTEVLRSRSGYGSPGVCFQRRGNTKGSWGGGQNESRLPRRNADTKQSNQQNGVLLFRERLRHSAQESSHLLSMIQQGSTVFPGIWVKKVTKPVFRLLH